MRIALYSSPLSGIVNPTGVGQHVRNMFEAVAASPRVEATVLSGRRAYEEARPHLLPALGKAPVCYLPGQERLSRAMLLGTRLVTAERWTGDVDWVYCAKEQPVSTRSARLAVTVHDVLPLEDVGVSLGESIPRSRRWRAMLRQIVRRADLVLTVSEFTRSRLLAMFPGLSERRIEVVGNGVRAIYFQDPLDSDSQLVTSLGLDDRPYLITVGSLTERKGGSTLIELARMIARRGLDYRIIVTGRRHEQRLLRRLDEVRKEEGELPLRLLGYVPEVEQAALLRRAEALVFPSRYEGFGIPALEAMACRTPVICSRAAALPEVVGDSAAYVSGDSAEEILKTAKELSADASLRKRLIHGGWDRACQYAWDRCAEKLLTALGVPGASGDGRERTAAVTGASGPPEVKTHDHPAGVPAASIEIADKPR